MELSGWVVRGIDVITPMNMIYHVFDLKSESDTTCKAYNDMFVLKNNTRLCL